MSKKTKSRYIKVVLEYDGRNYFGFQKQPKHKTIQSEFEKALSSLLNRIMQIGAASGRTDSGVSAKGQVLHFETASSMTLEKMQKGLNALLPKDIAVKQLKEVNSEFHARFSVKSKMYEYTIWNSEIRSPLHHETSFHVPYLLDVEKMKKAALVLMGKHDFKSFCAADPSKAEDRSTVRTITKLVIVRSGHFIRIRIAANGFLYKMVRNIVGALVDVGQGKMTVVDLKKILKACDRTKAGKTAPAEGLVLYSVSY